MIFRPAALCIVHDLRHAFASHLVMAGIDITTVKEILGHKEIKMTLRYANLAHSHKVKAVEIFDQKTNLCYNFATVAGITGDMVRDLMLESVHRRFGGIDTVPSVLQWLSDNGSAYIAEDTREFAALLGLQICTTPYRSPESNGMAEAFVKTFKRDYISVHGAPDAVSLMNSLSSMFDDYNENAPHKGLRMLSPKQFRRLQNTLEGCPV